MILGEVIFRLIFIMVGQQFTPEQRNLIALEYHKLRGSYKCYSKVMAIFNNKFPGVKKPTIKTVKNIWKKQNEHFSVHNLNSKLSPGNTYSGRPRSVRTPPNIQAVKDVLDEDAIKDPDAPDINSARKNVLGISKSSWQRIAKDDLHYHSYKLIVSQKLKPEDHARRVRFANNILNNTTVADTKHTAFSDEATFSLDGEINTQNTRRYAPQKVRGENQGGRPEQFRLGKSKYPQKVMVFLGVYGNGETWGLKFIEEGKTMDGNQYYWLVRNRAVPELKRMAGGSLDRVWWQQDGASVHRQVKTMKYLDSQFMNRTLAMGSISGFDWPARSPDLNPLDFCVWGVLKERVFKPRPATMAELKDRIRLEVSNLDPTMICKACLDVRAVS